MALRQLHGELLAIWNAAGFDAHRRKHSHIAPEHLAWTVLSLGDVDRALRARGVQVDELREALAAKLDGPPRAIPGPAAPALLERTADVVRAVSDPHPSGLLPSAHALLRALVSTKETAAYDILKDLGPILETPFSPIPEQASHVVFWDDDETPVAFVAGVLKEVFLLRETDAIYLVLLVHAAGCASVRSCPPDEAAALATHARKLAREARVPLRVTVTTEAPVIGPVSAAWRALAPPGTFFRRRASRGLQQVVAFGTLASLGMGVFSWRGFRSLLEWPAREAARCVSVATPVACATNMAVALWGTAFVLLDLGMGGLAGWRLARGRTLSLWATSVWFACLMAAHFEGWFLGWIDSRCR